jgi:glycosyltransferase involved in cell wall biosynthesis
MAATAVAQTRLRSNPLSLSVIVPAYNEEATIGVVLERLLSLPLTVDVLVVDDGSSDNTRGAAKAFCDHDARVRLFSHKRNRGKGAAIRTALPHIRGELVVIQDADLETDPRDLLRMVALFDYPTVSVVYGSRWLTKRALSASRFASWALSWITDLLFGSRLTDESTCYKMFRSEVLRSLELNANGFDFCPEVTAKALLAGYSIEEVPISYSPRPRFAGKKIGWLDGIWAIWRLVRCRLAARRTITSDRRERCKIQV